MQTEQSFKCKICNNDNDNRLYSAREMMYGFRDFFDYFECAQCGCLQIVKTPNDISKYYPATYYSFTDRTAQVSWIRKIATKIRDNYAVNGQGGFLGKHLYKKYPNEALKSLSGISVNKNSKILDVGCGTGVLLHSLKEIGFKDLLGIDLFLQDKYVKHEKGLTIEQKVIDDLKGKWDVIMFHHCYEHVEDPLGTLRSVYERLSDVGSCIIRIPISSSFAWQHYKTDWVQLDAPRHSFIHSIESMGLLAKEANLTIEKIVYDSTSMQFWGSEQYIKDIPLKSEKSYLVNQDMAPFSKDEIEAFKNRSVQLNENRQGDQAAFYLKKATI